MWRTFPTTVGGRFGVPGSGATVSSDGPATLPVLPSVPHEPTGPIDVPDLLGMTPQDARRSARFAELRLALEEHPTAAGLRGRVFRQVPEPGASVRPGQLVTAFVGARPAVTVPDVRGADEEVSLDVLRAAGLHPNRRVVRRSDKIAQGQVIRTRPRAGAEVPLGSRITYIVAAPPRPKRTSGKPAMKRNRDRRTPEGSFLSLPDHG